MKVASNELLSQRYLVHSEFNNGWVFALQLPARAQKLYTGVQAGV